MEVAENPHHLLLRWRHRARSNQQAHYYMAIRLERTAWIAGAVSAILSATVTVLVVFAAKIQPSTKLSIATLIVSILVTTITTISASSKWSDKASQHHSAAVEYGKVFRKIEETLANLISSEADTQGILKLIREKLDRVPSEAPAIPPRIWKKLPKELTPLAGNDNEIPLAT
jgi:hypothetical protein